MNAHKNARTTPHIRELIVARREAGWPVEQIAVAIGVSRRTVYLWTALPAQAVCWISGDLGANIYPASPVLLARPNGKSARREPQQMVGF